MDKVGDTPPHAAALARNKGGKSGAEGELDPVIKSAAMDALKCRSSFNASDKTSSKYFYVGLFVMIYGGMFDSDEA